MICGNGCLRSLPGHEDNTASNNDVDSLTPALRQPMIDDNMRERVGAESVSFVMRFCPDQVFNKWEQLFIEVADS